MPYKLFIKYYYIFIIIIIIIIMIIILYIISILGLIFNIHYVDIK